MTTASSTSFVFDDKKIVGITEMLAPKKKSKRTDSVGILRCAHTCMSHVFMYVSMCVCMYVCMCVCVCVYVYMPVYVCMYVCMHMRVCVYTNS